MLITLDQLKQITNIKDDNKLNLLFSGLNESCIKYSINTKLRLTHFLAQIMVESEGFTAVIENLNYSAKALLTTFPTHFTAAEAQTYQRQPEKIANRAYGNRMGNGNEASGDGWKYRGAGFIQITGKSNFIAVGKSLGIDLINHPELLQQPNYAILSAGWYWNDRGINAIADKSGDDVSKVTKVVNGGLNGENDRVANYIKINKILG